MTATRFTNQPKKKPEPRRKPHQAETDYARWALNKLELEGYERALRPKA